MEQTISPPLESVHDLSAVNVIDITGCRVARRRPSGSLAIDRDAPRVVAVDQSGMSDGALVGALWSGASCAGRGRGIGNAAARGSDLAGRYKPGRYRRGRPGYWFKRP
jgi:hypothetical protein